MHDDEAVTHDETVPRYDLSTLQQFCRWKAYRQINHSASAGAQRLGFDEDDIEECVQALTEKDFYKCIRTDYGWYQDVYKPTYLGKQLYVKLDLTGDSMSVISFKEDTSK